MEKSVVRELLRLSLYFGQFIFPSRQELDAVSGREM